jgi:hypothetical protein
MTATPNNLPPDFRKPQSPFVPIHAAASASPRRKKNEVTSMNVNTSPYAKAASADRVRRNRLGLMSPKT